MMRLQNLLLLLILPFGMCRLLCAEPISTITQLREAVDNAGPGADLELAAGVYELKKQLILKAGMTLRGSGMGQTTITHAASWQPSTKSLPDPEMRTTGLDTSAYLVRLDDKASGITISDLTLRGPGLHGAIYGFRNHDLHLHDLRIEDTLWSGIRTFSMKAKIHDCEFVGAGGRWKRGGEPGTKGGITGGAIFAIWMTDSEIYHNRFTRTQQEKADEFYGIKVRQGRRCRIHHNTIEVNFSIEMPFENDEDVEIDHNICHGTISVPKYAGGPVPDSGKTFHIHHNYFRHSYSIEFVRNGIEIDHNLFDFDVAKDVGNLISGFGKASAKGPAEFHNNLINNPGRGVIWINEPYSNLIVRNNHIITRTTKTPRTEGLFGFNRQCQFDTFQFIDNIVECVGTRRPLMRNAESYRSVIENNQLSGVSDVEHYRNLPAPDRKPGPARRLLFQCGVHGELSVDDWKVTPLERDGRSSD